MLSTQKKKLIIPEACICLTRTSRFFRLVICALIRSRSSPTCLYCPCKFLINVASAKNRLVYASIIRVMAGKRRAGVFMEIICMG